MKPKIFFFFWEMYIISLWFVYLMGKGSTKDHRIFSVVMFQTFNKGNLELLDGKYFTLTFFVKSYSQLSFRCLKRCQIGDHFAMCSFWAILTKRLGRSDKFSNGFVEFPLKIPSNLKILSNWRKNLIPKATTLMIW